MGALCAGPLQENTVSQETVPQQAELSPEDSTKDKNGKENILVIWDFDKSLINEDSDFYLFEKFGISNEIRDGLSIDATKYEKQHSLDKYSYMNFMNNTAYPRLFLPRDSVRDPKILQDAINTIAHDLNDLNDEMHQNTQQSPNGTVILDEINEEMMNNNNKSRKSVSVSVSGHDDDKPTSSSTHNTQGVASTAVASASMTANVVNKDGNNDGSNDGSNDGNNVTKSSIAERVKTNPVRITKEEMRKWFSKIPFYDENIKIVNKLYENNINQLVLSCGHTLFIKTVLTEYKLINKFDTIIANESNWALMEKKENENGNGNSNGNVNGNDDEMKPIKLINYDSIDKYTNDENNIITISEKPYLNEPPLHCNQYKVGLCSPHMCKGTVIDNVILPQYKNQFDNNEIDHILYIGDGGGDYCGVTRLRKDKDFVFVRKGLKLEKLVNYENRDDLDDTFKNTMKNEADQIKITKKQILYWENGEQLLNCFATALPNIFS